jgi:protein-disulfide isomerase
MVATNGKKSEIPLLLSKDNKEIAHVERVPLSFSLPVEGRPIRGNPNAKVTVVSFDDFQCPYCSEMHEKLFPGLLKEYGDKVRFIYKDYPLEQIHPWAVHAAVDANCLAAQNGTAYWDYADYLHANQKSINKDAKGARRPEAEQFTMLDNAARQIAAKASLDQDRVNACLKQQDETAVRASIKEGDRLGVDGTPTVFVNGERTGNVDISLFRSILDRALVAAGEQPPPTSTATVTK